MIGAYPVGSTPTGAQRSAAAITAPATSRVQRSFSIAYEVRQRVQRSFSLAYTVAGASTAPVLTRVQRSFSLAYQVRARVARSFNLFYAVEGAPPVDTGDPAFVPSVTRTIRARPGALASTGGDFWNMTNPAGPTGRMDPDAAIDITMDWGEVLTDVSSAIARADIQVVGARYDAGFTVGAKSTVFISAPDGDTVQIRFRIDTASVPKRTEDRTVFIKVAQQ